MAKNDKVDIKKKPALSVSGLGIPERSESGSNLVFKASWSYPDKAWDTSQNDRFQGVIVRWIVDLDMSSTKIKKNRKKKASLTGTKKRIEQYDTYSGKSTTSASFKLDRRFYHPFKSGSQKNVKIYQVLKAKYKNGKWKITKKIQHTSMELSELNTAEKNKDIYSRSALVKFPSNANIIGRTFYISKTSASEVFKQAVTYPVIDGVGVQIQGWNEKSSFTAYKVKSGNKTVAAKVADKSHVIWTSGVPVSETYYNFSAPPKPKIEAAIAGGGDNQNVTFTVTADNDDGTNAAERYQSRIWLDRTTGFKDGNVVRLSGPTNIHGGYDGVPNVNQTFSESVKPKEDTGRDVNSLEPDEFISYTLRADNQGVSGDSADPDNYATFLIARPHDATITEVVEDGPYYRITFNITGGNDRRRTDGYRLERLYNYRPESAGDDTLVDDWTDARWDAAAAAENDSAWTDTGLVLGHLNDKNGNTISPRSFTDLVINAKPKTFRRTYYRIVPFNSIEGLAGTPSKPVVAPGFAKIPSALNQVAKIVSCSSAENGNAIMAVVAFNKTKNSSGYYNSNGTEMTWDTFAYAWQSSTPPSSYDFKDDVVAPILVTQERKEDSSLKKFLVDVDINWVYATYYLRGVQSSQKYYVKARRFLKDTETRESDSYSKTYAEYSVDGALAAIEVKGMPTKVKLSAPDRLVEGKDLSVSWAYDSPDEQKAYHLAWLQGTGLAATDTAQELVQKEDSAPYAVVKWDLIEPVLMGVEGRKDHLYVAVRMCVEDGNWSEFSDVKDIKIVRAPKASIGQMPTVLSQPVSNTFGTDDPACSIIVRVVAHQLSGWGPTGRDDVAEGTIVYSAKIHNVPWAPTEVEGGTWYYYNHQFPHLDLRTGGHYTMEYTAVNDELDLSSDTIDQEGRVVKQVTEFGVGYTEQLVVPTFYAVADPLTEEHGGSAKISIKDTPGFNENCVVDVYRVTPDGAYLIRKGVEDWRDTTITDKHPPYSRYTACSYRLAIRSENGTVQWSDRSYAMPGYSVRFDWGEVDDETRGVYAHLTLPYNLKWSDSWTKNSRIELHLDGTYNGYWRGGVDHKNTLSTELVKLTGAEQIARVRALANFSGPVLVRLPNGCAFYADVQVSNLDVSYDSLTVAASFSAQEIRPSESFLEKELAVTKGLYVPSDH